MVDVRRLTDDDRSWAHEVERDSWGDPVVARRGELVDPRALPGFVAVVEGERAGLVTYAVRGDECEVVTIRSLREGIGVGRALLDFFAQRPQARILSLNDWLRDYCAKNNITYLDYFSALVDEKGMLKKDLADDGLHPNAAGYKIMAPMAEAAIEKALANQKP